MILNHTETPGDALETLLGLIGDEGQPASTAPPEPIEATAGLPDGEETALPDGEPAKEGESMTADDLDDWTEEAPPAAKVKRARRAKAEPEPKRRGRQKKDEPPAQRRGRKAKEEAPPKRRTRQPKAEPQAMLVVSGRSGTPGLAAGDILDSRAVTVDEFVGLEHTALEDFKRQVEVAARLMRRSPKLPMAEWRLWREGRLSPESVLGQSGGL